MNTSKTHEYAAVRRNLRRHEINSREINELTSRIIANYADLFDQVAAHTVTPSISDGRIRIVIDGDIHLVSKSTMFEVLNYRGIAISRTTVDEIVEAIESELDQARYEAWGYAHNGTPTERFIVIDNRRDA